MIIKYSEFCEESCYVIKVYNNSGSYLGSFFFLIALPFPYSFKYLLRHKDLKNIYNNKIIQHGAGGDLLDLKVQVSIIQVTNKALGKVVIC